MKSDLKESLNKERKEMGKLMMTKKQRRLYGRINYGLKRKRDAVVRLEEKREKYE
jgi:pescadillo protein